jgi:hypothetical protein
MTTKHADPAAPRMQRRSMTWLGWILGVLPMLFLLFSATMKFMKPKEVVEGFTHLGWPEHLALPIGIAEAAAVILYLFPRTAVLGAILVTGYMGGAIATHVRLGEPFYLQAGIGVVAWLGLFLRDPLVRSLLPLMRR